MPKQRQTCTECSMRRQKCDRKVPCSRCVKRGEPDKCTREWPKEGYDPKVHRTYPRPEKDDNDSKDTEHSPSSDRSLSSNPHTVRRPSADVRHSMPRAPRGNSRHNSVARSQHSIPGAKPIDPPKERILSFITWGSTPLETFNVPAVEMQNEPRKEQADISSEWNFSNGFESLTNAQISFLQMLLPPHKFVEQLVEFHLVKLAWWNTTIHVPTFRKEFQQNLADGLQVRDLDLRWVALLFSIMAASMCCAKEADIRTWGIRKAQQAKLARQWFKATLTCLNLADYMWKHHVYSLQAICTLSLSGHLIGFSNTQSTLLSAAIKIAQSLGLQRLGPEETVPTTAENYETIVRVETGRRVWHQLCVQDWFSIPFSEMYSIQKHHFTTLPPLNYDEDTLELVPEKVPTIASYLRNLQALGRIMSDCHDAVLASRTEEEKYDTVMLFEAKINYWKDGLAFSLDPDAPNDPSWPELGLWTRRSLLICYSHKIMMIHRNFLGRSFNNPSFAVTRHSCISAAKTIIRETQKALESDAPIFWIDHAFMVAAGITLCLDIFHRSATDTEANVHRSLVEHSITILAKYEGSMIAARGIRLLSSLLTEQARTVATQSLDKYNRTKRMREADTSDRPTATSLPFGDGLETNKRPRQKFDVPRFVESLGSGQLYASIEPDQAQPDPKPVGRLLSYDPNTAMLKQQNDHAVKDGTMQDVQNLSPMMHLLSQDTPPQPLTQEFPPIGTTEYFQNLDLNFETFEQMFPPQSGISNSYLFEDLLNFDF